MFSSFEEINLYFLNWNKTSCQAFISHYASLALVTIYWVRGNRHRLSQVSLLLRSLLGCVYPERRM